MSMTVKKGDTVLVITGKDKGKTGKVLEVFPKDNRVLIDGINIVSRHKKARSQQEQSAIVKKPAPIDASNVMVVCGVCNKATRVAHKVIDGKKVRVCKKCSASLDKEYVKATKKEAKKNVKADARATATKAKAESTEKEVKKTSSAKKTTSTAKATTAKTETKTTKTSGTKTQKSNTKKTSSEG